MGITERARARRKRLATGVDRDKGNSARLKLVVTPTPNGGVVNLSHQASR
jgi:hypothetical protein